MARTAVFSACLGLIFVFLAVDEAAELHGLMSLPIRQLAHTSNALLFAWVHLN